MLSKKTKLRVNIEGGLAVGCFQQYWKSLLEPSRNKPLTQLKGILQCHETINPSLFNYFFCTSRGGFLLVY